MSILESPRSREYSRSDSRDTRHSCDSLSSLGSRLSSDLNALADTLNALAEDLDAGRMTEAELEPSLALLSEFVSASLAPAVDRLGELVHPFGRVGAEGGEHLAWV